MTTPKDFESKIGKFECRRCNECCRKPGFDYVSEAETESIADFLKVDVRDFMERYCEVVDRQRIVLKKLPDEACIFLNEEGCSIHPAKPGQCRDFPVLWRTPGSLDYCAGLKKLFS